jgi:hypothetical protein
LIELTLYTRAGCHLCDEMKAGLELLRPGLDFHVTEVEVGWEGDLAERYGRLLPVLEMAGQEISRYFLDEERVRAALAGSAGA